MLSKVANSGVEARTTADHIGFGPAAGLTAAAGAAGAALGLVAVFEVPFSTGASGWAAGAGAGVGVAAALVSIYRANHSTEPVTH